MIPALEAAASLPGCLEALREAVPGEIWLVDGGSRDETRSIAAAAGCRLAAARRGRGRQLQAGAALASGPWLLFLHADTRLSSGWGRQVADFIRAADAPAGAAAFRLRLDSGCPAARRVERLANCRARLLGLPYGDQGLLIHRALYDRVGGYPDWPLMEDVALVRALGRRRLRILPGLAVTPPPSTRGTAGGFARSPTSSACRSSCWASRRSAWPGATDEPDKAHRGRRHPASTLRQRQAAPGARGR